MESFRGRAAQPCTYKAVGNTIFRRSVTARRTVYSQLSGTEEVTVHRLISPKILLCAGSTPQKLTAAIKWHLLYSLQQVCFRVARPPHEWKAPGSLLLQTIMQQQPCVLSKAQSKTMSCTCSHAITSSGPGTASDICLNWKNVCTLRLAPCFQKRYVFGKQRFLVVHNWILVYTGRILPNRAIKSTTNSSSLS